MNRLIEFLRDEEGATAIEYALIAALIAVAIAAALYGLGGQLSTLFTNIGTCISSGGQNC